MELFSKSREMTFSITRQQVANHSYEKFLDSRYSSKTSLENRRKEKKNIYESRWRLRGKDGISRVNPEISQKFP